MNQIHNESINSQKRQSLVRHARCLTNYYSNNRVMAPPCLACLSSASMNHSD